jgi:hypothetical protein
MWVRAEGGEMAGREDVNEEGMEMGDDAEMV